ncbi:hypothetical protein NQ318_016694, partial [Aromia moschata]
IIEVSFALYYSKVILYVLKAECISSIDLRDSEMCRANLGEDICDATCEKVPDVGKVNFVVQPKTQFQVEKCIAHTSDTIYRYIDRNISHTVPAGSVGFCEGNCRRSVREYHRRYPNRRTPNHQTFKNIERRLRENGMLKVNRRNAGRPRQARTILVEEEILERVDENPETSVRLLERQVRVSKSTINRVLTEQLIQLLPHDLAARLQLSQIIQQYRADDMDFHKKILFTDESCFTRRGITNLHNEHVYADENPHAIRAKSSQREFSINVWMAFINNSLIGPIRLPNRLHSNSYLDFLQNTLPDLFDDLPLNPRNQMYFMHDGAPPHFARIVRENDAPRSPDLNPCDFFIWGDLKQKVYSVRIENEEQLWNIIQNTNEETLRRVHFNFLRRIDFCINGNGGHFDT